MSTNNNKNENSSTSQLEWEPMFQDAEALGLFSLSIDELNLVLGGNAPSSGQEDMPTTASGGFQQAIGNIANASAVGAIVGSVAGVVIGTLAGPAGAAAGEWAGSGAGAAVGTFLGSSLAGAAAGGYEVGLAYPDQVNGIVDGFTGAAQEYQNNPPPI